MKYSNSVAIFLACFLSSAMVPSSSTDTTRSATSLALSSISPLPMTQTLMGFPLPCGRMMSSWILFLGMDISTSFRLMDRSTVCTKLRFGERSKAFLTAVTIALSANSIPPVVPSSLRRLSYSLVKPPNHPAIYKDIVKRGKGVWGGGISALQLGIPFARPDLRLDVLGLLALHGNAAGGAGADDLHDPRLDVGAG